MTAMHVSGTTIHCDEVSQNELQTGDKMTTVKVTQLVEGQVIISD